MVVSTSKEYNVNNFELDRLSTRNYDFELDRLNTSNEDLQEMETKYDYVLVSKDIDNEELREDRDRYEENLRHRGLDLEFVRPISDDLKNICFVLVHAPLDPVLFQKAEDMHIQMPLKDEANSEPATSNSEPQSILTRFYRKLVKKRLDPFTIKEPNVCIRNWNTVTSFSKSNVKAFQKKDDNGFFENAERSRMVKRILQLTSFTVKESKEVIEHFDDDTSRYKGHGIEQLCHIGVYDSYYPMHDGPSIIHNNHVDNDRQRLRADWATFSMSLKYQPLDAIRDYFGVRVGFYFAWLGLYTSFLVPAAVVGLLCFLYGLSTMNTAQPLKEIFVDERPHQSWTHNQEAN